MKYKYHICLKKIKEEGWLVEMQEPLALIVSLIIFKGKFHFFRKNQGSSHK